MGHRILLVVAAGGALGAAARWATGLLAETTAGAVPWHTLAINIVGCLLIGIASRRIVPGSTAWGFVVTGGLGGFTTMSLLAVELNDLVDAGRDGVAAAYVAITLAGGTAAVLIGEQLRRPRSGEPMPAPEELVP